MGAETQRRRAPVAKPRSPGQGCRCLWNGVPFSSLPSHGPIGVGPSARCLVLISIKTLWTSGGLVPECQGLSKFKFIASEDHLSPRSGPEALPPQPS